MRFGRSNDLPQNTERKSFTDGEWEDQLDHEETAIEPERRYLNDGTNHRVLLPFIAVAGALNHGFLAIFAIVSLASSRSTWLYRITEATLE